MFTGIIQEIGKVKRIDQKGAGKEIIINCSLMQTNLQKGASIAVDGICLTVVDFREDEITVEAMQETIRRTTLKNWYPSSLVNLERAAKADTRLDGHIVQGHIDCTAHVIRYSRLHDSVILEIEYPPEYAPLLVEKGSVAVNGVSLTVSSLTSDRFSLSLVGFTIDHTNLSLLKPGSRVNLEFDIIGKYINRYLSAEKNRITEEQLHEEGY